MSQAMNYHHNHHQVNHHRTTKHHHEVNMQHIQSHRHLRHIQDRMQRITYQHAAQAHRRVIAAIQAPQIQIMTLN